MHMKEYIKTAKQAAASFYRMNSSYNKDEVFAEAYLAMMEAMTSWDPIKGRSLKSWIGFMVHRHLRNVFWRQTSIYFEAVNVESLFNDKELNAEELLIFLEKEEERKQKLSFTAREAIALLENEISIGKKNETKREIKKELTKKGVSQRQIKRTFQELRMTAAQI